MFSCDDAQCPLGIPEESFPATNFLRLPGVDGRVIGMRTVGDMLLVTTERWAYIIAGNNESNYRLMKVSSSMPGVGTYQMDEFPTYSGAEGEPTTLFYLGRDRIVYQWTVGGQVIPISKPIQNILDASGTSPITYQQSRIHCASVNGRRIVIVLTSLPGTQYQRALYTYDIDNQTWQGTFVFSDGVAYIPLVAGFTTIYGLDPPVNEIIAYRSAFSATPVVRSWLRDDQPTSSVSFSLTTFPHEFRREENPETYRGSEYPRDGGDVDLLPTTNESHRSLSVRPSVRGVSRPARFNLRPRSEPSRRLGRRRIAS